MKVSSKEAVRQMRYQHTIEREKYIKKRGYQIEIKWECEFQREIKRNDELKHFVRRRYSKLPYKIRTKQIIEAIEADKLYGIIECDISTPDHLKSKFDEMAPIFKNVQIPYNQFGDYMKEFVMKHNLSQNSRTGLVGSMKAEKMMFATPLLKYYLELGLQITHIYIYDNGIRQKCMLP